jgi:hypothetical protein
LVEPHEVRADTERTFLHRERGVRAMYFDVLRLQARDELRHAQRISLIRCDRECVRCFVDAFAPGVEALR